MKKNWLIVLLLSTLMISSCGNADVSAQNFNLAPNFFADKINQVPDAVIVDVRTPEEYQKGHLPNAINIDYNAGDFENKIGAISADETIFLYCLSGSRSTNAAKLLHERGYKNVYQLNGGILKWQAAGLPVTKDATTIVKSNSDYSIAKVDSIISKNDLVLIDVYAEWCGPCKQMAPFLKEIAHSYPNLKVVKIDADKNQELMNQWKIEALPTLFYYNKKVKKWQHTGFLSKQDLINKMNL